MPVTICKANVIYRNAASSIFGSCVAPAHIPLLRSFIQKIRPGPRLIDPSRNMLAFYGEGLLAPRPTPKLENHPFPFVRCCLFNIFAAKLQLEAVPSTRNPRTRLLWWQGDPPMDLLEIWLNVVDWIGLAQDRYRWRALVNSVMNLRVP
jgi:hypothetical protein